MVVVASVVAVLVVVVALVVVVVALVVVVVALVVVVVALVVTVRFRPLGPAMPKLTTGVSVGNRCNVAIFNGLVDEEISVERSIEVSEMNVQVK